jgi:hypothetical protein
VRAAVMPRFLRSRTQSQKGNSLKGLPIRVSHHLHELTAPQP